MRPTDKSPFARRAFLLAAAVAAVCSALMATQTFA